MCSNDNGSSKKKTKSETEKFTFDVSITFIASIVMLFCSFLFKPILVYFLFAEGLGLWTMTITINELFLFLGCIGIPGAITKYVAEYGDDEDARHQIFSCGIVNLFVIGLVVGVILYFFSAHIADIFGMPELKNLIEIIAIFFPFSMILVSLTSLLTGLRKMKLLAYVNIFSAVLSIVLVLLPILLGWGIKGAVLGSSLTTLLTTVITIYLAKDYLANFSLINYMQTSKKILRFGSTTTTAGALGQIMHKADIIMIGYFLSTTEVGIYSVALALARMIWMFPKAISRVSYPAMSEYWGNRNTQALKKMVDKATKYTACVLLPIGLLLFMFSNDIISIIFSKIDPLLASPPLRILLVGTLFHGVIVPIGAIFASTEKLRIILLQAVIVAISNIILNVMLIPIYGIVGAAIATTTSLIINFSFSLFYMKKLLTVRLDTRWFIKLGFISLISISVFFILSSLVNNHIIIGVTVLLIYCAILALYLLEIEDRKVFIDVLKRIRIWKT
jgi:O-antigen/teichoic acid export membrane protein